MTIFIDVSGKHQLDSRQMMLPLIGKNATEDQLTAVVGKNDVNLLRIKQEMKMTRADDRITKNAKA